MFTIVSSKNGLIIFTTDNEEEADREYYSLILEDGLEVEFL